MSKAVVLSIRPKWCEKIASGEKTIEVRKTRPKLDTPFKCYIYCTAERAGYDALWVLDAPTREKYSFMAVSAYLENPNGASKGNGKVIGEFTCERIVPITYDGGRLWCPTNAAFSPATCLSQAEIIAYIGDKGRCYGWHISNLKIYDTPKELIEFHTWKKCKSCSKSGYESTACIYDENCMIPAAITKAPQSWCYVEAKE
jgi:predicted transcriptional regulator